MPTQFSRRKTALFIGITFALIGLLAVLIAESALRLSLGHPLFASRLEIPSRFHRSHDHKATETAEQFSPDAGLFELYQIDPPLPPERPVRAEVREMCESGAVVRHPNQDLRVFNINYLASIYCQGYDPHMKAMFDAYPGWVYTYGCYDRDSRPAFRFFANSASCMGMNETTFNNFGWSQADLAFRKPPQTVRLAFVGASTTQLMSGCRWAYPDFVGAWLNELSESEGWGLQFEVINTGRAGQISPDMASIVRHELLPVEPDLVVYYEGRNQFIIDSYVQEAEPLESDGWDLRDGILARSALAQTIFIMNPQLRVRLSEAWNIRRLDYAHSLMLENSNPDEQEHLYLPEIIADLDSMHRDLRGIGAEFVMCDYAMLADPEIPLHPIYQNNLIRYWELEFPEIDKRDIWKLSQFRNRVFREYADSRNLPFIAVDSVLCLAPDVFFDGVHLKQEGMRLQAWLVFQQLLPLVRQRLDSGEWPRPSTATADAHPQLVDQQWKVRLNCDSISALQHAIGCRELQEELLKEIDENGAYNWDAIDQRSDSNSM